MLTFHPTCPSGRIVARIGEHDAGVIFPEADGSARWRLLLDRHGTEKTARTELAAQNSMEAAFADWCRRAGLGRVE